jgi:anti-sigma B factor antagonist
VDEFETTARRVDGWDVLTVTGELDAHTGPALRAAILDLLAHHHALVIDMTGLGFLDSSGLGILVSALRRIRNVGGQLKLVVASDSIRKLMRLTALDLVFDISGTVEDATATPPAPTPTADEA